MNLQVPNPYFRTALSCYFPLEDTAHLNPAYPIVWTRQSFGGYFGVLLSHMLENPSSQGSREDEVSIGLILPDFGYS